MSKPIKKVLIVGGGASGWITANILASQLKSSNPNCVKVTLVESPNIPIIGVGEGTVPAIRQTLQMIGLSEDVFLRECDATFKQAIDFVDWVRPPTGGESSSYYHLFNYPSMPGIDTTPYWLMGKPGARGTYADAVSYQGALCKSGLGPKDVDSKAFSGVAEYAYHLDAVKFAGLLARHGVSQHGVEHLLANVTGASLAEDGSIRSVTTDTLGDLEADLYIDCTGFASKLLGDCLSVPFVDKSDVLFVDRAVTAQVPYADASSTIASTTISTAVEAGWIWDIGLTTRRGVGYVYSTKYTDELRAEKVLRDHIGLDASVPLRHIDMQVGYRDRFFEKNCLAIGLSAGFVEPLEATALMLVEATAKMLAAQFPAVESDMSIVAKRMNRTLRYSWDRVIDFIKLHYFLSRRDDSQFWLDNTKPDSVPDSLLESLELWRHRPPTAFDFSTNYEVFGLENYQYVLYGMGFESDVGLRSDRYQDWDKIIHHVGRLKAHGEKLSSRVLPHRKVIERILSAS